MANFGHVLTFFADVLLVLGKFHEQLLFECCTFRASFRHAIDSVDHQVKTIQIVEHRHIEGGGEGYKYAWLVEVGRLEHGRSLCREFAFLVGELPVRHVLYFVRFRDLTKY